MTAISDLNQRVPISLMPCFSTYATQDIQYAKSCVTLQSSLEPLRELEDLAIFPGQVL